MKSKFTLGFICLVYFILSFVQFPPRNGFFGGGDSFGYHLYLPAVFIHHDIQTLDKSFASLLSLSGQYSKNPENSLGLHEANAIDNGRQVIKYTCGIAIINAPFFLLQKGYYTVSGKPVTGFEDSFAVAMKFTGICFLLFGFLLLRMVLRLYFSDGVTAFTLAGLAFGTNLFYMTNFQMPLSHLYLFGLYAALLYFTLAFYKNPTVKHTVILALIWGLIVLIRPNEFYSIVLPLLWGVSSLRAAKERMVFLVKHYNLLLVFTLVAFLVGLPQLIYWKYVTSHWIFYSYGNEGFNFLKPEIIKGLFSHNNGWLAYTPLMYLAVGYLIIDFLRQRKYFSVLLFLVLHLYVVYSWWCWFYMGSYGSRPMAESYPWLSLPLSASIAYLLDGVVKKIVFCLFFLFAIYLNISETFHFQNNRFISEAGSKEYRFNLLGKTKLNYNDLVLYDTKEWQPEKISNRRVLFFENFDTLHTSNIALDSIDSHRYLTMRSNDFFIAINRPVGELNIHGGQWIKASVEANASVVPFNLYLPGSLMIEFYRGDKLLKSKELRIQNKINNHGEGLYHFNLNQWGEVHYYSQIPDDIKPGDIIKVYIALFNPQAPDLKIDNFSVEVGD